MWTYPFMKYLLPSVRSIVDNARKAQQVLGPVVRAKLEAQDSGSTAEEGLNGLDWLCSLAEGKERKPIIAQSGQMTS